MNKESLEEWLNDETYIMAYRFNYDSARDFNEELKQYVKDLQNRVDKAIEYINDNSAFMEDDEWEMFNKKELLDILRGEE